MTLLEELERAEKGSRELDIAIRFEVIGDVARCNYDEFSWCSDEDCECPGCGKWLGMHDERGSYPARWQDDERLPHYTTSLDAALTLVPRSKYSNLAGFLHAVTYQMKIGDIPDERIALKVCLEALKAREHQKAKDSVTSS